MEKCLHENHGICILYKLLILPHEDAFCHGACLHVLCLNALGGGWMDKVVPDPVHLWEWILEHYEGELDFVVVNGQFHLEWVEVVDEVGGDETASNGEDEILMVSNSEKDATEVSAEENVSDAPSTEIEDD